MAELKIVVNDKSGKSYQKVLAEQDTLVGRKLGDKINGNLLGLTDYELEITGGSDHCGFPMRKDLDSIRKKILAVSGIGVKKKDKGIRQRKTVAGNTITEKITQVNLKVLTTGKKKLEEIFGTKEATSEKEEKKKTKESPKKEPEQKAKTVGKKQPKAKVEEKPKE